MSATIKISKCLAQQSKVQKLCTSASIQKSASIIVSHQLSSDSNSRYFSTDSSFWRSKSKQKSLEKLKEKTKRANLFDQDESDAFKGDVLPHVDSDRNTETNMNEGSARRASQEEFHSERTNMETLNEQFNVKPEEIERRKKIERIFAIRRYNASIHPWEPFFLAEPLSNPNEFKIPNFYTQDPEFERHLQQVGWNTHFDTLSDEHKRIYILWLLWRSDYEYCAKRTHDYMKYGTLTIQAVNDLIFVCSHLQYFSLGHRILDEGLLNRNLKPNKLTFMILWTFFYSNKEKFGDKPIIWRKMMQDENIEWDGDFEAIFLGRQIYYSKFSPESILNYCQAFWWPLNNQYKSGTKPPKTTVEPRPLTYQILIGQCNKHYQFIAERAFAAFMDSKFACDSEAFENVTTRLLLYYVENKLAKEALKLFKDHFISFASKNSARIAPPDKLFRLIILKLLKKKNIPWEETLEFLEIASKSIPNMPGLIYRTFLTKLLQTSSESRMGDERLPATLFVRWCCPNIVRKIVVKDDYSEMGKPKPTSEEDVINLEDLDQGWTKYDLRLLEDDFDQFTQISKRVKKVSNTPENPLNYYTPTTEIHEFINFNERSFSPTIEEYQQIMSHIGKYGYSDEGATILHIYEADGSISKNKGSDTHMYANMVSAYCKNRELGKGLALFNREFKSGLPKSTGTRIAPEYLLINLKYALQDAQNTSFERIIDGELTMLRTQKSNPNHLYSSE